MTSESQKKATVTYMNKHDRLTIRVKKGKRDEYRKQAAKRDMSLQAYVLKLLDEA